jgi:murein DD-endopeptidase MepM/ murein hydrolase activator NlpD
MRCAAPRRRLLSGGALAGALLLAACGEGFDVDLRDRLGGFGTAEAVQAPAAPRPPADDRGVISYPSYQVAVARRGDTVASVAARIGLGAEELARYNGLAPDMALRPGEILALPRRVAEPGRDRGAAPTSASPGGVDVAAIATSAIDRAEAAGSARPGGAAPSPPPPGTALPAGTLAPPREGGTPVRHQVQRGETAYTIARLYGVPVRALADWNGLGPDLAVREGQYLMIPQPRAEAAPERSAAAEPAVDTARPGEGSRAPAPPSAAEPLPAPEEAAAAPAPATPPSPDLAAERTAASARARLALPVQGAIIRAYQKGRNEGIDISAPAGAEVKAAEAGTVAAVTRSTDNVAIVILRHDGARFGFPEPILTVYANLEGITVERGQSVARGQTIGRVRAGNPSFIRFELRKGFETLDPSEFLE